MFLEMIANTAAAAAATTGLSEQAKFTMQHLQYLFQALTYAGAFAAIGFAAMGSAYGCGTACAAAVGAWKKCYSQNKPAPFQLLVFAGAPLSQVIYGMIIMFVIMGKPDVTQAAWVVYLLVGVIGQRLDHTLANVSILYMLDEAGKEGRILDDYSEMQLVSGGPVRIDDTCAYFSLLNLSGQAEGVTIKHAKYPLQDAAIHCEYQYGVSNEVLPGETAEVTVARGKLLLIKIFA